MREKCPYSEFLWSVFSRIQAEYGKILRISPYSVGMPEQTDQKNSEYGHFLSSEHDQEKIISNNKNQIKRKQKNLNWNQNH